MGHFPMAMLNSQRVIEISWHKQNRQVIIVAYIILYHVCFFLCVVSVMPFFIHDMLAINHGGPGSSNIHPVVTQSDWGQQGWS